MRSSKNRCATRRVVWRMTPENQLGEILELSDESNAERKRHGARSGQPLSGRATIATPPPDSTEITSISIGEPPGSASRTLSSTIPSSWRASSYDLLQGLTVRDVSERIPQRAFEALFSADAANGKRR